METTLPRETLVALINEGLSQRGIAARLQRSHGYVRHWLKKYNLQTEVPKKPASSFSTLENAGTPVFAECPTHGETLYTWIPSGKRYRCKDCLTGAVALLRVRVYEQLLDSLGVSACELCSYNKCKRSLHFHHVDPSQKEFSLNASSLTNKFPKLLAEARKCVLLCANCHGEVEEGITLLPPELIKRAAPHLIKSKFREAAGLRSFVEA